MTNESGLRPMEFNVVVRMDPVENKVGSIFIPESKKERDELSCDEGTLVALSPHAFTYADWPEGQPHPAIGARVMFAQYSGRIWERGGIKYRILKDKDIVAVIEPPAVAVAA